MKKFQIKRYVFCLLVAGLLYGCRQETPVEVPVDTTTSQPPAKNTPVIRYSVVNTYPHDSTSFTEGFLFHNGQLFESSGAPDDLPFTRSMFGTVDLKTGKIEKKGELDRTKYFGEGIVILKDKLYQLTWQNQTCFIYDAKTFRQIGLFNFINREGWGLTTNGKELIMSDGTNALTFINPDNFQVSKTLIVTENNYAIDHLNELEYINGFIYANVWMTNTIVKIDPESGEVVGKMDLSELTNDVRRRLPAIREMNGIAYDSLSGKVLVTGKMWPKMFEIKFPI